MYLLKLDPLSLPTSQMKTLDKMANSEVKGGPLHEFQKNFGSAVEKRSEEKGYIFTKFES